MTDESGASPNVTIRRPFHWGVFFAGDKDSRDFPDDTGNPHIVATAHWASIPVRHASDTEPGVELTEVNVDVHIDKPPPQRPEFVAVMQIDGGIWSIGDADGDREIALATGAWRVSIDTTPPNFAEHVNIWLNRADT